MYIFSNLLFNVIIFSLSPVIVHSDIFSITLYKNEIVEDIGNFRDKVLQYYMSADNFFRYRTRGDCVAKIDQNVNYIGNILLGVPAQRFTVNVDTSFSGLWIPSSKCYLSSKCFKESTSKYDHDESEDYEPDMVGSDIEKRKIIYGNLSNFKTYNEIDTELGFDTLKVDDAVIHGQHMMEATDIAMHPFGAILADGVFGLGFPQESLRTAPPFFTMLDRGVLDKPQFSLTLGKFGSELFFGGADSDKYKNGTLAYHNISTEPPEWMININSINVSSIELCKGGCKALIDTGTALIAAPNDALNLIYRQMGFIGEMPEQIPEIPCNSISAMPNLEINIDGQLFTVWSTEYTIKFKTKTCGVGIMKSPTDFWIFGNMFLTKISDVEDALIELATLLGVNVPKAIMKVLIKLLYEDTSPQVVYNVYKEKFS